MSATSFTDHSCGLVSPVSMVTIWAPRPSPITSRPSGPKVIASIDLTGGVPVWAAWAGASAKANTARKSKHARNIIFPPAYGGLVGRDARRIVAPRRAAGKGNRGFGCGDTFENVSEPGHVFKRAPTIAADGPV